MGGFTYDYFKQIHYRISQLLRISKTSEFQDSEIISDRLKSVTGILR